MTDLGGKIALVTGGGQGLGKAISEVLSQAGALVVIGDINKESSELLASELQKNGGKAKAVILNVADEKNIRQVFGKIKEEFGGLDILINNAGIDVTKSLDEISSEQWKKVLEVNLIGPFLMTKEAFSLMGIKNQGHIVNICSTAAKRAWANASAYHASKWGLLGFSHAVHVEGRQKNIKVTAVLAGGMKTPFILERFPEAEENLQEPENVAQMVRFILTLPEETVIPEVMVIPMRETSWP